MRIAACSHWPLLLIIHFWFFAISVVARQGGGGVSLQRGISLAQQNRLEEAEREFDAVPLSDPSYWRAQYYSAVAKAQLKKNAAARELLGRFLREFPDHPDGNYLMGMLLEDARELRSAEIHFHKLTATAPQEARGWIALGRVLAAQGRGPEAERSWKRAEAITPGDASLAFSLGTYYRSAGRHGEAARYLLTAWRADRSDREPAVQLAVTYVALKDIANLDSLIAQAPEDISPAVREAAGLALIDAGDQALGFGYLVASARERPKDWNAQKMLADSLFKNAFYQDAQSAYRRCLELKPDDGETQFLLGRALYEDHEVAPALEQYERAIALRPSGPVWFHLGIARRAMGQPTEAGSAFEKALASGSYEDESLYNLGILSQGQGDNAAATMFFQKAVTLNPKHAEARYELGRLKISQGEFEEGLKEIDLVLKLRPDHTQAHYQRATALTRIGRRDEAERSFLRFQELEKRDRDTRKVLDRKVLVPSQNRD